MLHFRFLCAFSSRYLGDGHKVALGLVHTMSSTSPAGCQIYYHLLFHNTVERKLTPKAHAAPYLLSARAPASLSRRSRRRSRHCRRRRPPAPRRATPGSAIPAAPQLVPPSAAWCAGRTFAAASPRCARGLSRGDVSGQAHCQAQPFIHPGGRRNRHPSTTTQRQRDGKPAQNLAQQHTFLHHSCAASHLSPPPSQPPSQPASASHVARAVITVK